jgi:phage terminase large subunit
LPRQKLSEVFRLTDKQTEFYKQLQLTPYCLYGGAAGGGKSYALRAIAVLTIIKAFAQYGVRDVQVGLFCEDYPALTQRHLSVWRQNVPEWLGEVSAPQTEGLRFKLKHEFGSGRILLGNLDDVGKYDSSEFAAIFVDESTKNQWAFFDGLRKRLRWPQLAGQPHLPCGGMVKNAHGESVPCADHAGMPAWSFPLALGANPGGLSHAQHKKAFIDKDYSGDLVNLLPISDRFGFVKALSVDNPHLPDSYKAIALDTLNPKMRAAYADGDWSVYEGQYYSHFDSAQRSRPAKDIAQLMATQSWQPKWISVDWGFAHHTAVYWHTTVRVTPAEAKAYLNRDWDTDRDIFITYRERVVKETGQTALANLIVQGSIGEEIKRIYLSPDAFAKRTSANTSAQEMGDIFHTAGLPRPAQALNERVNGWRFMGELMTNDEWYLSSDCPQALQSIPLLSHDPTRPEDVEKTTDVSDDICDSLRYGLFSHLNNRKVPESIQRQRILLTAITPSGTDYNKMALLDRQFTARKAKRNTSFSLRKRRR